MVTKFILVLFLINVQTGEQSQIRVQKFADSEEICTKAAYTVALEAVESANVRVLTSYQCKAIKVKES